MKEYALQMVSINKVELKNGDGYSDGNIHPV